MRSFDSLDEKEILALAISQEEEDARIYDDFADGLKESYPTQSEQFAEMRREEDGHRHRLIELYRDRFGEHIPLIRAQDVRGFVKRRPVWLVRPLGLNAVRKASEAMELETKRFYEAAARRSVDAGVRQLLGDLAEEERHHAQAAEQMAQTRSEERRVGKECRSRRSPYHSSRRRHTRCLSDWSSDVCSSDLDAGVRQLLGDLAEEERHHAQAAEQMAQTKVSEADSARQKRLFVLQVIQPGLAGLMDGSVSTLAPLFAAALATHSSGDTLRVGLAASLGAGISMGFAEALSDDGSLTGRGHPWARGGVCGLMTTLGGLGHSLPYLINDVKTATWIAGAVVLVELAVISWVRHKYMDSPWSSAAIQVVVGGLLVFGVGLLIGSS